MHRLPEITEKPRPKLTTLASIPVLSPVFAVGLSLSLMTSGAFWNAGVFQPGATWSERRLSEVGSVLQDVFGNEPRVINSEIDEFRASEIRPRPLAGAVFIEPASRTDARQLTKEQQTLAQYLARRYRVALESTQEFVELSYRVAKEMKLDPWLILAIMGIESSFDPNAQSNKGAQGLMQVLTRVHADKFTPFGGVAAAFDPLANIKVGAKILKGYIDRDGSIESGLKSYVGAAFLSGDSGYGEKVLLERERLAAAAEGRPINTVTFRPAGLTAPIKSVGTPSIIEVGGQPGLAAVETVVLKSQLWTVPSNTAPLVPFLMLPASLSKSVVAPIKEPVELAQPRSKVADMLIDSDADRPALNGISDTTQ